MWIVIALMPIRILIWIWISINMEIRIKIGITTMPIHNTTYNPDNVDNPHCPGKGISGPYNPDSSK
jgi:hypothetical protein